MLPNENKMSDSGRGRLRQVSSIARLGFGITAGVLPFSMRYAQTKVCRLCRKGERRMFRFQ